MDEFDFDDQTNFEQLCCCETVFSCVILRCQSVEQASGNRENALSIYLTSSYFTSFIRLKDRESAGRFLLSLRFSTLGFSGITSRLAFCFRLRTILMGSGLAGLVGLACFMGLVVLANLVVLSCLGGGLLTESFSCFLERGFCFKAGLPFVEECVLMG